MNLDDVAIKKLNERVEKLELENASLVQDVNLLNVLKPGVDILQGSNGNFDNIPVEPSEPPTGPVRVNVGTGSHTFTLSGAENQGTHQEQVDTGITMEEGYFIGFMVRFPTNNLHAALPFQNMSSDPANTQNKDIRNIWAVRSAGPVQTIRFYFPIPDSTWNGSWRIDWEIYHY